MLRRPCPGVVARNRRLASFLALAAVMCLPLPLSAQFRARVEIKQGFPLRNGAEDRGWTFCRLMYTSGRREAMGSGWTTDYPDADHNLMIRMSQLTHTRVSWWSEGQPGHTVMRLTDPGVFHCPFLYTSDVGTIQLDGIEVERLRTYLLKGGFFWVDDFWGSRAWDQFAREITRVLPEYKIVDIPSDHPILNYIYQIKKFPQIPSIQFWRRSGGATSERGADSDTPHFRGIFDSTGRLMVVITHNTDIADGWEREAEDDAYFYRFSWDAYAVAVNIVMWSLTH
jgi:hypothetical protein